MCLSRHGSLKAITIVRRRMWYLSIKETCTLYGTSVFTYASFYVAVHYFYYGYR